jgi:hypothetical protein
MYLPDLLFSIPPFLGPVFQKLPDTALVSKKHFGVCPSVIFRGQFRAEYALIPLEDDSMQSSQPLGENKGRWDFRREDE